MGFGQNEMKNPLLNLALCCVPYFTLTEPLSTPVPAPQKVDDFIHQMNRFPVDKFNKANNAIHWLLIYHYPPSAQPGPGVLGLLEMDIPKLLS